jgi:hypothetical protein
MQSYPDGELADVLVSKVGNPGRKVRNSELLGRLLPTKLGSALYCKAYVVFPPPAVVKGNFDM